MENPAILRQENEDNLNAQRAVDDMKRLDKTLDRIGELSQGLQKELRGAIEALSGIGKQAEEIGDLWEQYMELK